MRTFLDKLRDYLPIPSRFRVFIGRIDEFNDAAPGAVVRLHPHDRRRPIPEGFIIYDMRFESGEVQP